MNEASERIIAKAEEDEEFRTRLIADPKATVEAELGVSLPGTVAIRVVEEQPGEVVIVLPAARSASDELRDDELASVAGGFQWTWEEGCAGIVRQGGPGIFKNL